MGDVYIIRRIIDCNNNRSVFRSKKLGVSVYNSEYIDKCNYISDHFHPRLTYPRAYTFISCKISYYFISVCAGSVL